MFDITERIPEPKEFVEEAPAMPAGYLDQLSLTDPGPVVEVELSDWEAT